MSLPRHPKTAQPPLQQETRQFELSRRCFCCNDTGLIDNWLVSRFLIADYSANVDIPVVCRRIACDAASEHGWPIERLDARATPEQCDGIHRTVWAEIRKAQQSTPRNVPAEVAHLSQSKSFGESVA